MKRVLSLVLVLVLVLGAIMPAFAEETASQAALDLETYGVIAGNGTDLGEAMPITRAQMAVLYAKLQGKATEAEAHALPTTLTDVADAWYTPWVSYVAEQGWMVGSDNMFRPMDNVTVKEVKVLLLKALGYEVVWETVDADAETAEIVVTAADATLPLGSEVFAAVRSILDMTPVDGTETLGAALDLTDYVAPVTPVVVSVDSVVALSQTLVEVTLEDAVEAAPATAEFMVKDADDAEVAISAASIKNSGSTVILTVAEMTANNIYTLTHDAVEYKFVAIANETAKPQLTSAVALTNTTVKLTFNENVDENALNIANYAIDGLAVLKAEYDVDGNGAAVKTDVILTTAVQTTGTIYKVVVTNVTDLVGNVINADNDEYQFGGLAADATKPQLTTAVALTNTTVELTFNENVDEATAENIANYAIEGLNVLSAERQTNKAKVVLTTVAQTTGTIYKVVVTNVTDTSANVINSDNDEFQFGGLAPDTTKPQLSSAVATTNVKVKLTFNENVEEAIAEDIANYTIEGLTIVTAERQTNKAEVVLTTSAQTAGTIYKVVVVNVTDVAGNVINSDNDEFQFGGLTADTTKPSVSSAVAASATTVKVTFSEVMDSTTAAQAFNYYLGSELGYPTSIAKDTVTTDGTVWVLTTKTQESKVYTVDVTGVKDASGNVLNEDNDEATFGGLGTADTTAPKVTSAVALNNQTIKVTFNEKMDSATIAAGDFTFAVVSGTEGGTPIAAQTADAIVVATDKLSATLAFDTEVTTSGVVYSVTVATVDDANGNTIAGTNNAVNFAGINTADAVPSITSIVAIDNQTLKVTFSEKVLGAENVVFAEFGFSPAYGGALGNAVLASDGMSATYYFTSAAQFTAGTVYTTQVLAAGVAKITDEFGLDTLKVKSGQTYAEATFAGIASGASALKISAITAVNTNTIDISFNKAINMAGIGTGWIEAVNLSDGSAFANSTIKLVRAEGDDDNKIRVFFDVDNTLFTAGTIYQVKLVEGSFLDLNGTAMLAANDAGVFAANSASNAAPKMVSAAAEAAGNTVLVTFSEDLDTTGLDAGGLDFTITASNGATVTAAVAVGTDQVRLTLSGAQTSGEVITVTYANAGGADVLDEAAVAAVDATKTVKYVAD